ncbi:MAG: glycosyltransferase family 39 protein [Chloroflexia bacterium]
MTRREWRDLGILLALSLAIRLGLYAILPREHLVSDEAEYLAAAWNLANGRGFSFYAEWPWLRPPLYLLFVALFLRLFASPQGPLSPEAQLAIRLAQIVLSLAVPALLYGLGRAMWSERAGKIAASVAALAFPLASLPHLVLAENLFLPLFLGAVTALVGFVKAGMRRTRIRWLIAAGLLFGLATLTRGVALAFLPLVCVWAALQGRHRPGKAFLYGGLLAGTVIAVLLPWALYTWKAFGRPIWVDTTGGYNFWLGTQGGQFRNSYEVHQTLLALPDPSSRQAYAYRKGWQAVTSDPGGYLRGRVVELRQLLRINYSADERLVDGFSLGAVSVAHLVAIFCFEDLLYLFLVPAALAGLFLSRREPARGAIFLWLGYSLGTGVLFFAIGRFRLSLWPFLALYAGVLEDRPWRTFERRERFLRLGAALVLSAAFWTVVLPSCIGPYPSASGATRLALRSRAVARHLACAERALAAGDLEGAWDALVPALAYRPDGAQPLPTVRVVLARWLRASGRSEEAIAVLEGSEWPYAVLLRGDLFRARGDLEKARAEFSNRRVIERNPVDWAYSYLEPPPVGAIDLGNGLDWGLIQGFYRAERDGERTFRWSKARASLRFPGAGTGAPLSLHLRYWAWRPAGEAAPEVQVLVEGAEVARFTARTGGWSTVTVALPASPPGSDVVVQLRCSAFVPGPRDLLNTGELRVLGLMLDTAEVWPR